MWSYKSLSHNCVPKMAFIMPGLSSRDISFSVADDHMGSDHFPIQISLDKPLKRNTPLTEPRCRFDKTNDDLLHNTLKYSLSNINTNITTQDELEELAVTLCDKLMKAVDTSTPKVYNRNDPKSPISQAILDLIKEKRRLRRLYNNTQDPNIKSTINKLQKQVVFNVKYTKMLSFSLVAEALTGLIYHRPSGENSRFLPSFLVLNCMLDSLVNTHHFQQYSPFSLHYWSSWIMSDQTEVE